MKRILICTSIRGNDKTLFAFPNIQIRYGQKRSTVYWTRVVTRLGTEAWNSPLSSTDTKNEHCYTSAPPTCLRGVNRNNITLNPFVISNNITLHFTMYLWLFAISWHWGHHKCPRHSSLAIRVTRPDCGATRSVPNWSTTDRHATNVARSLQFLLVCSGSTVNITSILFSPLCTLLIKLTEFIFNVAPCISKIHLSLHTNKCTKRIYYLYSVLIIHIKTLYSFVTPTCFDTLYVIIKEHTFSLAKITD
jgi:hypothetical protein